MDIKNTNIRLYDGAYILEYCPSGNEYGERVTLITYNIKKTAKKYKKEGFYLFGCPLLFSHNVFYKLTKSFDFSTRNRKKIIIENAMEHITNAVNNGNLQID